MFTVSVIVPNFNNEKYISQCLDSILSQTYPIKEIIVYDDCSTDNSKAILNKYANEVDNLSVLYGKQNVGVSVARDTAIHHTTSDYVCMLDSDDFFYTDNKIENEMKMVEQIYTKTGETVIAFSQTVDVDECGVSIKPVAPIDLSGSERFRIITRLYSNYMPRDYCFPRELYDSCGGYTKGLSLYEDWELNIKLLAYTRFVFSGGYGTAYRHKDGGLSSVDYMRQLITKKGILKKYKMNLFEKIVAYGLAYASFYKHQIIKV